jgi:hypothetical protein
MCMSCGRWDRVPDMDTDMDMGVNLPHSSINNGHHSRISNHRSCTNSGRRQRVTNGRRHQVSRRRNSHSK